MPFDSEIHSNKHFSFILPLLFHASLRIKMKYVTLLSTEMKASSRFYDVHP
jgi:hypothetical protein